MFDLSRRALMLMSAAAAAPFSLAPLDLARAEASASPADAAFEAFGRRALVEMLAASPIFATVVGLHDYDDQLPDLTPAGFAARADLSRRQLGELEAMPRTTLSRANQVDAALLENSLKGDIWTHDVLQSWAWDPLVHNDAAGGALYGLIAREFAPLPDRLRSAAGRMEKMGEMLAGTRRSLDPARVPDVHAKTYAAQHAGVGGLVDMIAAQGSVLQGADKARLEAAAASARTAAAEHQAWIDGTLVPNAKGDFRIGADLYDAKLAFALNSPLSRAEIKARAETAMTTLTAEMYALARGVLAGREDAPALPETATPEQQRTAISAALELAYAEQPPRDAIVAFCEGALAEATAFVRARNLVTVPDEPVRVIEMPEFQRGVALAYCDPPGPLDKGQSTFFAVSPIPDDWTDVQVTSFLREYNTRSAHELTIHEAMPGHYLQLAHSNRYPSTLPAVLSSGPFAEGWACYTQDVMADAGYLGGDPLYRLVHLKWQLRVIGNALLDQAVHIDGMERDAAIAFMVEHTYQQEREAAGKWTRAQLSSTQLPTYFVGWQEHHALRAEVETREGAAFDMKRYHDTVLSFGTPPVRYARALMLDEPITG